MNSDPQALTLSTEFVENFVIQPNNLYNKISNESVTKLAPVPNDGRYINLASRGDNQNPKFQHGFEHKHFIDTAVMFYATIPVTIELETAHTAAIDANNYVAALNNMENICLRQYGLVNAINNITLTLNSTGITQVNDVGNNFKIVSNYYGDEELNEYFEASMGDKYADYNIYNSADKTYDAFDDSGKKIKIFRTQMEHQDPFKGASDNARNSRKLTFTYTGATGSTHVHGKISLATPIPFSLFSLKGHGHGIYGVQNFDLSLTLYHNFVERLFSTCNNAGTKFIKNISISTNDASVPLYSLIMRAFNSTQEVTNRLSSANGMIDPYRIGYTRLAPIVSRGYELNGTDSQEFNSEQLVITRVPKAIYVGIKLNNETVAGKKYFETPDVYARIQTLTVEMGNTNTNIMNNSARGVYDFCKGNGLNKDIETAMRGSGFPVKIMAEDIGWGTDTYIGEVKSTTVTIRTSCIAPVAGNYTMNVVFAYDNGLICHENNFHVRDALITNSSQFTADNYVSDMYTPTMSVVGGFGFGDILNVGRKIGRYIANNHKDIREGLANQWKKFQASGQLNNVVGGATTTLGAGNISSFRFK